MVCRLCAVLPCEVEKTYSCLGITCEEVGVYQSAGGVPLGGMTQCTDASTSLPTPAPSGTTGPPTATPAPPATTAPNATTETYFLDPSPTSPATDRLRPAPFVAGLAVVGCITTSTAIGYVVNVVRQQRRARLQLSAARIGKEEFSSVPDAVPDADSASGQESDVRSTTRSI